MQIQYTPRRNDSGNDGVNNGSSDVNYGSSYMNIAQSAESTPEHTGGVQTPWHVLHETGTGSSPT